MWVYENGKGKRGKRGNVSWMRDMGRDGEGWGRVKRVGKGFNTNRPFTTSAKEKFAHHFIGKKRANVNQGRPGDDSGIIVLRRVR